MAVTEKPEKQEFDEKIVEIELERLRTFQNHPFKVCIFREICASVPKERSAIPLETERSSAD